VLQCGSIHSANASDVANGPYLGFLEDQSGSLATLGRWFLTCHCGESLGRLANGVQIGGSSLAKLGMHFEQFAVCQNDIELVVELVNRDPWNSCRFRRRRSFVSH